MTEADLHIASDNFDWKNHPNMHRFEHKAMATIYEITIFHENEKFAEGAAHEAFKELDWLEDQLSRYRENSDIARINNLQAEQSVKVGPEAFECIIESQKIYKETGGAFDITMGPLYDVWLDEDKRLREPSEEELKQARRRTGMKLIEVDAENFLVKVYGNNVVLDLGGVGKGYAVDVMSELLREWGVDIGFIHGGTSSVKAMDAPPGTAGWPMTISTPGKNRRVIARFYLENRALSGSGLQKGEHIIDPRMARPVAGKLAAWTSMQSATRSDALSTAFMIMTPQEVQRVSEGEMNMQALVITHPGSDNLSQDNMHFFGTWDTDIVSLMEFKE